VIDYQGLLCLSQKKAKEKAKSLYPEGDPRRKKKEKELENEYYRQYTTPPQPR